MAKKVTRSKLIKSIPLSFGILQNIADDLRVTRSAVSKFLGLPENQDLKSLVEEETKRIFDYAKMNVARALLTGDIDTAKWLLSTYPDGLNGSPKKYKSKKFDWKNEPQITFERDAHRLKNGFYHRLVFVDKNRQDVNAKQLPGRREIVVS